MTESAGILTPSATRALLDRLGHRPRRQLGQNFLIDGNIVRKSLELAGVSEGDRVVEVGPGLGTLTGALLGAGAEVFAIERDPTLAAHLRESLAPTETAGRFHLLEDDAVDHPRGPLSNKEDCDFKIVANLPYAICSPWMEGILGGPLPRCMVLMLQLEAAQRYAANPGTKAFGAISVFLQAAYEIAGTHRVSRSCFYPVPDVDSTLIHLERRGDPYAFSADGRDLIRRLFQQRRKQLGSMLRRTAPELANAWLPKLEDFNIRPDARAEDIPVEAWVELDRLVSASER